MNKWQQRGYPLSLFAWWRYFIKALLGKFTIRRVAVVLTAARPELQSTHRHSQSANVEFIKLGGNPVRLINSSMHYGWKGTLIFVFIWALFVYVDERGPYMGPDEVIEIL